MNEAKRKDLERQGYRLAGEHSAVKICLWAKKSLRGEGTCYKQKFYGINSHRCVQMTPSLPNCTLRCEWCWRDITHTTPKWAGKTDDPEFIIDECIKKQLKLLEGFGGNEKTDKRKYAEARKPLHFAISLAGEPMLYPKLPAFLKALKKRGISSFLVSNGTCPEALRVLKESDCLPTQLYITLPAPNEETFNKCCAPLIKDGWEKILESLSVMKGLRQKTRTTIRLTLAKGVNMSHPDQYAKLITLADPLFVEVKAYMHVGYSKKRLSYEDMPTHAEIVEFAKKVAEPLGMKIVDEQKESRVVLLMREDASERKMKF
jgi:tRNA wybutosine-synthesizing protein 1